VSLTTKHCIISIVLLSLFFLIIPVSAEINVTADSIGTTYVTWSWGTGLNITGLWVDGNKLCGYDTETPYVDIVDLTSCVNHTIMINTSTDSGTNTTMTVCGFSDSGIKVVEEVPLPIEIIICSLCLSFIILGVRKK
jgi:hypothetical protein